MIVRAGGVSYPNAAELGDLVNASVGRPLPVTVGRGDQTIDLALTPVVDCLGGTWGGVSGMALSGLDQPAVVQAVRLGAPGRRAEPGGRGRSAARRPVDPGRGRPTDPTGADVRAVFSANQGSVVPLILMRGDQRIATTLTPVRGCVGGTEMGRVGVILGPRPLPVPLALKEGAISVWDSARESVVSIGRVFGPQGVGRIASLLFTDAERDIQIRPPSWGSASRWARSRTGPR